MIACDRVQLPLDLRRRSSSMPTGRERIGLPRGTRITIKVCSVDIERSIYVTHSMDVVRLRTPIARNTRTCAWLKTWHMDSGWRRKDVRYPANCELRASRFKSTHRRFATIHRNPRIHPSCGSESIGFKSTHYVRSGEVELLTMTGRIIKARVICSGTIGLLLVYSCFDGDAEWYMTLK